MEEQDLIKQALRDFVATSNSGKYKSEDELLSKFPELSSYDKGALRDFVATSNSGKYKTEDEVFSKFPEFTPIKKKEPAISLGYEKPSEASRMGGLPKQEKLAQSPLKTAEITTPSVSTKSALEGIKGTSTPPKGVTKVKTDVLPSDGMPPDIQKPQPRLSAEEQEAQGMVTKQQKAEKALEFKEGVKQNLYDNNRYWLLQNKKEAQENGMTLKELQASRRKELANLLDEDEQVEANAIVDHLDAKKSGDDKRAGEALQQYYEAKNKQRAKFQSEMQSLQSEYDNIASRIEGGELDADLGLQTLSAIEKRQKNLEISQKAFLKPKEALKTFVQENATEIASVSKPTQTPYEQLEEYTNNLYAKVRQLKADLGYQDMGKGATLGGYAQDYAIRAEQDGGELLDELYAEELKLKTATKLLLLNRTPIQANETALGVLGKSFGNSLAPNFQKEEGTATTIANNVKEIIEDAKIGEKVYEEQKKYAEEAAKPYEKYSAKWFAEPVGASLAIIPEFIIGSLVSEGVLGFTKLGKLLTLAEKYGKIKGLNTTAKYINAINKNAAGKITGKIADAFIKVQANGLKLGASSEVVSKLFPSQEDEISFTTGYNGGVIGKGAELVLSGAVKNLFKVFGNKGAEAIKRISEYGGTLKLVKDAPKTVLGEVGEEFGESLGQIYKQSSSWKEVGEKIKEQYGTLDKATEFVVLTGIMALGLGTGNSIGANLFTASKEAYNNLPREQRAIVDSILDRAKAGDKQVEETVAEDIKKDIEKDLTPAELKEIETTTEETDGKGRTEETISAGTDVLETGVGMAAEPGKEGVAGEDIQAEAVPQAPVLEVETPSINLAVPENPYNKALRNLGYADADIEKMTIEQKQNIAENKIEAPVVESTAKVDSIKENAKQERIAEMQAELDQEATPPTTEGVESTVDNTIAADYLTTGGIGTVISTDYLLKGIAGFFTNANTLIDNIRNKYAKELSDKNLVDIKNFIGSDTYTKIVSEIKEALKKSYNNSAEIQNILDELLKMPTGMPQRVGFGLESRHNAELAAIEVTPTSEETVTAPKVSEALKDVESTAKALKELPKDSITQSIDGIPLPQLEINGYKRKPSEQYKINDAKSISEAYHKAKADGSNPKLVKAVEELLGKPTSEAKQTTKPVSERIAEQKAAEAASAKSKKQQVVKPILNKSIEVKSSEGKKGLVPISELEEFIGEDRLGEAQMPTSRERIDSLKKDISKNGFKEPIVIVYDKFSGNGEATIIEGNHRIIAAKELGLTEIPVTFEKGTIRDNESRTKNKMFPIKRKTVGKLDDTRGITGADLGLTVRQPTDADFVKPAGETSAKEAAKPTKTERKAIAEAKIDDLAAKAKEFLRNKNLPEGTKVSGVSQNKVIDILASTVKALVNSGIEISEAIKQVRELFEQDFDTSAIKDYEINQAIARDELTDVAKENGFSSYREAVFAVNSYVRPVGEEDVITKAEIEKAAKEKIKSKEEAKKATPSEKKGYTGRKKVSKFYKTALAYVQNTPTRLQDFLKTNPLSYGVVTNAESIKKAIDFIQENGFEETLKDFLTKQIKTDGEFEKIIFVGYLLRGGLSEAFTDISKSMNGVTDADELAALKKEADRIFNDMKAVTTLLAEGYFPSFGRAIQAGAMFAQDLSTEDGAIFHFTKLTEQAAAKAREVNKQEATEQVDTVKEVVEEGKAKAAKEVTEYIVKSKDIQAKNTTKLSKARKAASDAKEKLKAALAKYKILGIANDPWEQAKNDVATVKALTNYVAAQLKYKSVQASQIIKEVAALLGINPRYIPKADIQEIMDAAKVQAEKDMTFDEISNATTPKGVTYAERVGKELSNDPSAINKTVESIIEDYYMGNQTTDEIIDMVKQRFDVTDAEAITIAKQIQDSINNNITKNLEKQLDKKIKQLNDKRLKEEGKKPPKERKPVKSLYDIMAQAQVMGVLDSDSIQGILEELYNVPTVTPEDIQFVKDTYDKINNTGDLTRKAQLIADLHKRFAGKNPISFYDVYNSYWYSAVLSGPSTTDVNIEFGLTAIPLAVADMISGAFINSAKIIADKFKGKQNPSSVALEARLIFDSMWRIVFQTGTLNMDGIKRGSLFKKESIPFYESVQNLVSTIKRGPQAFNEELRNTEVSAKDNAYLKDYKPQGAWGKLISPLVWLDKKTGLFSFLPKYVPRAINAVDIFFGTALKNLNLAQTLKTYYVKQGLSGKDLAKAIKSDLYKSPELLLAARELAANDRLNIDLEIKQENGEFVVYDTGNKKKSFKTKSAANKYMTELSYKGDKYQKGVVDYLNATLPPDVIDATRRIAAGYVCTGDVEGARSKWFYNNIILNIRKATMDWADSKEQSKFTRAIKFATSRVVEFMKFPLNFNNLGIAYTPALAFMRAKYTGEEGTLYAQVYKDKAQQRFLTGFTAFMALTTPTLLSMLVLKSPDDDEEENKEDLKRRQELADKFFKSTGEKVSIDNPLFNLPKDGELTGSLSFLPANTKKFLKENNLAVPFRRWNAKLNIWEDYTISPLVYNLTMAASLADYVKYVINDKTRFNSVAQRAKEWGNVVSYFAGNLVQTFVNASGVKSQNQLLLTLNSSNYERILNAAVDMAFSPIQSTPALLRQLSEGLDMRLKQRVEVADKPFEYVASKTIPLGGLFFTGRKKHDMFGDEIAYLTGADRGFVLKHLFSVTQKDYEKQRTELGQFLNINGYSKYRDMITEYEKKNKEIIDIKNPTVEINGISYTNYLDKGFTDDEMYEIGLAAAKRAKQILISNKSTLQKIGNATDLSNIPLVSANYTIPFTESIDFIYDTIFKEEWESALAKKKYVSEVGENVYEANKIKSTIITDMLNVILTKAPVEKAKPIETKIPIEFNDFNEGD